MPLELLCVAVVVGALAKQVVKESAANDGRRYDRSARTPITLALIEIKSSPGEEGARALPGVSHRSVASRGTNVAEKKRSKGTERAMRGTCRGNARCG